MLRKRIALLRRRDDVTLDDFSAHWLEPHAAFITALPGIREYVQNLVEQSWSAAEDAPRVDGIVEVWFDDAAVVSPTAHTSTAQQDDEVTFIASLTAFTVQHRDSYDATSKIWVLSRDSAALHALAARLPAADATRVVVVDPDEDAELMVRERLEREASPSSLMLVYGFPPTASADTFREMVRAAEADSGTDLRVLMTRTRRIL